MRRFSMILATVILGSTTAGATCIATPDKIQRIRVVRCEDSRAYVEAAAAAIAAEQLNGFGLSRDELVARSEKRRGRILVAFVEKELTFEARPAKSEEAGMEVVITSPWHDVSETRRYWWADRWGRLKCDDLPRDKSVDIWASMPCCDVLPPGSACLANFDLASEIADWIERELPTRE